MEKEKNSPLLEHTCRPDTFNFYTGKFYRTFSRNKTDHTSDVPYVQFIKCTFSDCFLIILWELLWEEMFWRPSFMAMMRWEVLVLCPSCISESCSITMQGTQLYCRLPSQNQDSCLTKTVLSRPISSVPTTQFCPEHPQFCPEHPSVLSRPLPVLSRPPSR